MMLMECKGMSLAPLPPFSKPMLAYAREHKGCGYLLRHCQLGSVTAKTSSREQGEQEARAGFFSSLPALSHLGFLLDAACSLSCPQQELTLGALGVDDVVLAR